MPAAASQGFHLDTGAFTAAGAASAAQGFQFTGGRGTRFSGTSAAGPFTLTPGIFVPGSAARRQYLPLIRLP